MMTQAIQFAQHLLRLQPEKDAARLCLYNYIKNLCDNETPLNTEFFTQFFRRALSFEHWQKSQAQLFEEAYLCYRHFSESNPVEGTVSGEVFRAQEFEVFRVQSTKSMEKILQRWMETSADAHPMDVTKIVPISSGYWMTLRLKTDRNLYVQVLPPWVAMIEGQLSPLNTEMALNYGPELELREGVFQQLDLGHHQSAKFRLEHGGVIGTVLKGYTLQKVMALEGQNLHQLPLLFYPLKRLEQVFVDRKTDPMYQELTSMLEKAFQLIRDHHPQAQQYGQAALQRGRLAIENIFPDDKLAQLLINNLEQALLGGTPPWTEANQPSSFV